MSKRYQNNYWRASTRLRHWDYRQNASYFVTLCTQNKQCFFGRVSDDKVRLSAIGKFAQACWGEIIQHYPFVKLGGYIIMPNHVHGIITIDKPDRKTYIQQVPRGIDAWPANKFQPQRQNLAAIIRGYKIGVTKAARTIDSGFAWQSRYHDHIIRNETAYQEITQYIMDNPLKWQQDELYIQ